MLRLCVALWGWGEDPILLLLALVLEQAGLKAGFGGICSLGAFCPLFTCHFSTAETPQIGACMVRRWQASLVSASGCCSILASKGSMERALGCRGHWCLGMASL